MTIIGSKPISEMTEEELIAGVEELRNNREALRADIIKKAKEAKEKGKKEPSTKAPRIKEEKTPNASQSAALHFLLGDDE